MPDFITKEQNEINCIQCPNCSRLYPTTDEKGAEVDVPSKCRRCDSPMDPAKAEAFINKQAEEAHDPRLAAEGRRLRNEETVSA